MLLMIRCSSRNGKQLIALHEGMHLLSVGEVYE